MAKKKEQPVEATAEDMDQAYLQGKGVLLNEFLKEHKIALQPTLDVTQFGIRPNVQLVRYEAK